MSGARRSGVLRRPLQTAAWLVVVLAGLILLAWRLAAQVPPDSMAVPSVRCTAQAVDGSVAAPERDQTLPHRFSEKTWHGNPRFTCWFSLPPADARQGDVALFIPSFADALTVDLNGRQVALAELYLMRNLHMHALPAFVPLPDDMLRPGANVVRLTLSSLLPRPALLGQVYVGDADVLRMHFHARWFVSAVLPTLVVGGQIAFGVIFCVLWAARRAECAFGWLAVTLMLGAVRGSVLIPDFGFDLDDRPVWNMIVLWEITAALMFSRAVANRRETRWSWCWGLPALGLTLFFLLAELHTMRSIMIAAMLALVLTYMLLSLWVLAREAARGDHSALIVLTGFAAVFLAIIWDSVGLLRPGLDGVLLTRPVFSGFLLAVAVLMTLRFVRAMQELDNTAETLRDRVAQTQAELRRTYDELRVRRETEAVNRERTRIMRDLHDGLGGELASMLALADAPEPRQREIARHARAALADMRLIISSLEDYGGDLALALGSWRERAEPQLRAAGLTLAWSIRDVPALDWLGPAQTLDVLRIMQEAATNVIKHAQASQVSIGMQTTDEGICLTICDDGCGGVPQTGGSGIVNMRVRARRLHAVLRIQSERGTGTCVELVLPRRVPQDGRLP